MAVWCLVACASTRWSPQGPQTEARALAVPERIAFTPADDLLPSVDVSGQQLAFTSQQNGNLDIWVRDFRSQSSFPITDAPADDFDPDLRFERLLYVSRKEDAKGDIYLREGLFGNERRLTDSATADRQPRWSADGRTVYFVSRFPEGRERVEALDLRTNQRKVVVGLGHDPAPSPDGNLLIYTAPKAGVPQLFALRLTDGATVALTGSGRPEGFPSFPTDSSDSLAYVRFPDDDNGDGVVDERDQGSLWELSIAADTLFEAKTRPTPRPLTDGAENDLFPSVGPEALVYTRGRRQQDIARLPRRGLFPRFDSAARAIEFGLAMEEPRTRWFALRAGLAAPELSHQERAQIHYLIGELQLDRERPDLAREAWKSLSEVPASSDAVRTLQGLAQAERLEMDGIPEDRLQRLEAAYSDLPRVRAQLQMARAQRLFDQGKLTEAFASLGRVQRTDDRRTAALAGLRRLRWFESTQHPDELARATLHWMERYPDEKGLRERAAKRVVDRVVGDLSLIEDFEDRQEALQRIAGRYGEPLVERAARVALARRFADTGNYRAAASEAARAAALAGPDRAFEARWRARQAQYLESLGRFDEALEVWRALRRMADDLPVYGDQARTAIVRTSLRQAREADEAGDLREALAGYREVVEIDSTQTFALRREVALTARVGRLDAYIEQAETQAKAQPNLPTAHYRLGLARTYTGQFKRAEQDLSRSIELNPQFAPAYLVRGYVREMRALDEAGFFVKFFRGIADGLNLAFGLGNTNRLGPEGFLEQSIEDYKTAARLNAEARDPEFEADALLNLGNAHYRLGARTEDLTNIELAFQRYMEALRLGLRFRGGPRQEFVFWERVGRAAAWAGAWAESVTATRRALSLTDAAQTTDREAQLWGNLALAFDQSEEPQQAAEALEKFRQSLEEADATSRLVVALRDQARARLESRSGYEPAALWTALRELQLAQRWLEAEGVDPGEQPTLWRPVSGNTSRALFGFDSRSEKAVLLAFQQKAHERLGDEDLADRMAERRLELNREIERSIPKRLLFFSREITALSLLRERLGLQVQEVFSLEQAGELDAALERLEEIRAEAKGWWDAGYRVSDRADHAVDLAHLDALAVELRLRYAGALTEALPVDLWSERLDQAVGRLRVGNRLGPAEPESLPPPPMEALTGTVAWTRGATVALARNDFAAEARVRLAQARLWGAAQTPETSDQEAELDSALESWWRIQGAYLRAVQRGRLGGEAGLRVASMALLDVAAQRKALGHGSHRSLEREGLRLAQAQGAADLWVEQAVRTASTAADLVRAAEAVLPSDLGRTRRSLVQALVRQARQASGAWEALQLLDRAALLMAFGEGLPPRVPPAHAADEGLLRWLRAPDRPQIAEGGMLPEKLGDYGRIRFFAAPLPASTLAAALKPDHMWVLPLPRDAERVAQEGLAEIWLVRGSTVAGAPPAIERLPPDFDGVEAAVAQHRQQVRGPVVYMPTLVPGLQDAALLAAVWSTSPSVLAFAQSVGAPGVESAMVRPDQVGAPAAYAEPGFMAPTETLADRVGRFAALTPRSSVQVQGRLMAPAPVPERSWWTASTPEDDPAPGTRDATLDQLAVQADLLRTRWRPAGPMPGGLDFVFAAQGASRVILEREGCIGGEDACTLTLGRPPLSPELRRQGLKQALGAARSTALTAVRRGRFQEAAPALRRWLATEKEVGDDRYIRPVYDALVGVLAEQLDPNQPKAAAEVQAQLLEQLVRSESEPKLRAQAQVRLGVLWHRAGDEVASEAAFRSALESLMKQGADPALGAARFEFGKVLEARLKFDQAAEQLEMAVDHWVDAGVFAPDSRPPAVAVDTLLETGTLYMNRLADPKRARQAYARAANLLSGKEARLRVALARVRLARRTGRHQEAAQRAARAAAAAARTGAALEELEARVEQANAAWGLARYTEGERHCQGSLEQAERLQRDWVPAAGGTAERRRRDRQVELRRVFALSACGVIALARGQEEDALLRLQDALQRAQGLDRPSEVATQYNNLGRAYLELGRTEDAIDAFTEALQIDQQNKDIYGLAYDHRNLGQALTEQGSLEAVAVLQEGLRFAQQASDRANAARTRYALGEWHRRVAKDLVSAQKEYEAALEEAAALELLELRWQSEWALGVLMEQQGLSQSARRHYEASASHLQQGDGQFRRRSGLGPPPRAPFEALVRMDLEAARRVDALQQLHRLRSLEQDRKPMEPARWNDLLGGALDPDQAALLWRFVEGEVWLVWIRNDRFGFERVLAPELPDLLNRYRSLMESRGDLGEVLDSLSHRLLEPIEEALVGVRRVCVAVDGPLVFLAETALPWPGGADGALWVDVASSRRIGLLSDAPKSFQSPRLERLSVFVSEQAHRPLRRLSFVTKEAQVIRESLPLVRVDDGSPTNVRPGEGQSSRFMAALAEEGWVHFAGHADLAGDDERALDGGLMFEDRSLSLREIRTATVTAPVVVLSSCETGIGRPDRVDGMGFVQGLQEAGAQWVVATLLEVDDTVAAVFAKQLYRGLRDGGLEDSLRRARLQVREHWPHPAWWASTVAFAPAAYPP